MGLPAVAKLLDLSVRTARAGKECPNSCLGVGSQGLLSGAYYRPTAWKLASYSCAVYRTTGLYSGPTLVFFLYFDLKTLAAA
jgi:hypothetical protein